MACRWSRPNCRRPLLPACFRPDRHGPSSKRLFRQPSNKTWLCPEQCQAITCRADEPCQYVARRPVPAWHARLYSIHCLPGTLGFIRSIPVRTLAQGLKSSGCPLMMRWTALTTDITISEFAVSIGGRRTSDVVKGCRTSAVAMRLPRARSAGVGQASGEETAGRLRRVAPPSMGKVGLILWAGSDDWDRRCCGDRREMAFEQRRTDCCSRRDGGWGLVVASGQGIWPSAGMSGRGPATIGVRMW